MLNFVKFYYPEMLKKAILGSKSVFEYNIFDKKSLEYAKLARALIILFELEHPKDILDCIEILEEKIKEGEKRTAPYTPYKIRYNIGDKEEEEEDKREKDRKEQEMQKEKLREEILRKMTRH